MKPSTDSEGEEFAEYQKELRERANRSIQQLSNILGERSSGTENVDQGMGQDTDSTAGEDSWNQLQHSDAVNQLRSLLRKQQKEPSPHSPAKRKSTIKRSSDEAETSMPAVRDLVPIIHNQSEYIQHLEAEVKFCKEELLGMKQRVRVVIVENEKLHQELKSRAVEETLKDYTILDTTVDAAGPLPTRDGTPRTSTSRPSRIQHDPQTDSPGGQTENQKWQNELEQLKLLYQAQTETLEAQVTSLRRNLVTSQEECEDLKARLRRQEAAAAGGAQRVGGLCLKCAQQEAVLAPTHANVHIQAVERLTKERDDLMAVLSSLRAGQSEMQQREWNAYQQVKQAVEMAEEANLEKTRAVVYSEQVRNELARLRERLEKELATEQEKIAQAREGARNEARKDKEALAQTVASLSQKVAELEGQLDRGDREKGSLSTQLDEALRKLSSQETESSRVLSELRYQLSQAQLKREEVERELRDQGSRSARQLEMAQQEAEKLGRELCGCRQRLEAAQRDAGRAGVEALSLTERLGQARHQLHLTRKEKESAERCRREDVENLTARAEKREVELTQRLRQAEARHERDVGELDALLSSQNSLIGKLKEECHSLGVQLEELTETSRREVEQLSLEKEHLQEGVEKLRRRLQETEEQCVQHGRMHQRMKHRLQQLDQHCQSSAQQVMELLNKQNQLMQERQVLTEEMQNLRIQLPGPVRANT